MARGSQPQCWRSLVCLTIAFMVHIEPHRKLHRISGAPAASARRQSPGYALSSSALAAWRSAVFQGIIIELELPFADAIGDVSVALEHGYYLVEDLRSSLTLRVLSDLPRDRAG